MSENKQNAEIAEPEENNVLPSEITETAENNVLSSETAEPAQNDIVEGIVSNCKKLNIRKVPKLGSDIVCVVDAGTLLLIDQKESNKDFYKVTTEAGAEGFAMCQFVTIK